MMVLSAHPGKDGRVHALPLSLYLPRETGWALLTVETEVNGDSKSTNERGPSLVG